MYIPSANRIEDPQVALAAMRRNPFATIISVSDGIPVATHLPILIEEGEPIVLCGHIARQNAQWKTWSNMETVLIIFAGPHGYVSPRFYDSRPNVPTWNYVSVHAYGKIEIIEDDQLALEHLERLVTTFDPNLADAQPESMTHEFFRRLLTGIVVFRMPVDRLDAKAKLSQNKSEADQLGVHRNHAESNDAGEKELAEWMKSRPA